MNTSLPLTVGLSPQRLQLQWPDGTVDLPAAALRAACRCGPCRARALRNEAAVETPVELAGAEPVGQYALQLIFSDGHDRGVYPWALLRELCAAAGPAPRPAAILASSNGSAVLIG
ncbi:DUF971 domain-containing protein [Pelomonas aquatica]|jgi:DUF971 family protein|uniref:DUF971 domain-containing protein n=1 Tax=Pelomonas aquatica TaxID=431058 RepID=A0A9X4LKI6_9BURK|nr:DUF971 domain-containing protein [Pelomonas aquatica]MCY4756399.1 DUF971 domain-containing protein [Pelomonas aquatica]MDG0864621.1 DUF971 domain-containing protein [Pelomonas aquatica]